MYSVAGDMEEELLFILVTLVSMTDVCHAAFK